MINLSQIEKILIFENNLQELVSQSDLTIDILYYVLHDFINTIDKMRDTYISETARQLQEKMKAQEEEETS